MEKILGLMRKYWLLIVLIALVLGYIGINQSKYSATLRPLSTRGLPPPETDVPITLPADPGEAGKATLAGIDSDNDGVRDDLQREIVYMYPQNEEVRRVLRADMKIMQQILTTDGDHEYFVGLFQKHFHLESCYSELALDPKMEFRAHVDAITYWSDLFLNTLERYAAHDKHYRIATPFESIITSCAEIKGQY